METEKMDLTIAGVDAEKVDNVNGEANEMEMTFEEKKAVMKAIIEAQFERRKMRYKFTIWAWKDGNERKTHIGFTNDTEITYDLVRGFDHCELVDNVSGEKVEPIIVSSH